MDVPQVTNYDPLAEALGQRDAARARVAALEAALREILRIAENPPLDASAEADAIEALARAALEATP